MSIIHHNIIVTGKVQGVFFRDSTKRKAFELGIKGFVKNEEDGSVYIEVEGSEDALKKLEEWCKKGPERAEVDSVKVEEGQLQHFKSFEIRY